MRINTNMAALNAWRALESNQANLQNSLQRLSSGYRINRASDDAAGLAVSEKLKAQMRGVNMAVRNTQDAVSLIQTAEGGASGIQDMLQRMRELAVQAGSDTLSDADRSQLQEEFSSLQAEITRTSDTVQFNGQKLLNGNSTITAAEGTDTANMLSGLAINTDVASGELSGKTLNVNRDAAGALTSITDGSHTLTGSEYTLSGGVITFAGAYAGLSVTYSNAASAASSTIAVSGGLSFQVGANAGETIKFSVGTLTTTHLGVNSISINNRTNANTALGALDTAITNVSSTRAKLGAMQNRLDNTISTLQTQSENITSANSRIRDIDMASEMAGFTKFQVLSQASTAMLAQANQLPQGILTLLR